MVVIPPLKSRFKRKRFILKCIFIFGLLSFINNIALGIFYRIKFQSLATSLCSPFIDPTDSNWLIKFITLFTAVFQISTSIFICAVYGILIRYLMDNSRRLEMSRKKSYVYLLIQLIAVTFSNLLCWIPSNIIYLSSLFMSRYPTDLLIWTTIAVTPINSIINPLVFIITTLKSKP